MNKHNTLFILFLAILGYHGAKVVVHEPHHEPHHEPPIGPPLDPPGDLPEGAPDRVEPVKPTEIHAHVMPGESVRDAYEKADSLLAEGETVVLGIHGAAGAASMGFAYSQSSSDLFHDKDPEGINVAFIGMTEDAEIGPLFLGQKSEDFDPVKRAEFYDIGIHGRVDSFAVRQSGYVENIVFDNFWIVVNPGMESTYTSGFHFHEDWKSLTLKRYQARNLPLREHCFYIKHGGFTQVLDCELYGGNRTGFQARPHSLPFSSPAPHGAFIADGNWANDFGWNHNQGDGGQWITVWCSLEYPVRISNNRCTNARFGCLGILRGAPSQGPYTTDDNWSHSNVYVYGNSMENNQSSRNCTEIVDARRVTIGEGNKLEGLRPMAFGSQFSDYVGARAPGEVIYETTPDWKIYNYEDGKYVEAK